MTNSTQWVDGVEVILTDDEQTTFDAWQESVTIQAAVTLNKALAQSLLNKSDTTFRLTFESGLAWPSEWKTYCDGLRSIISSNGVGTLPTIPSTYPDGTSTGA